MYAIEVCECDLGEIHEFKSYELYEAFAEGFTAGANNYGAGGAYMLSLDDIEAELAEFDEETAGDYEIENRDLLLRAKKALEARNGKAQ